MSEVIVLKKALVYPSIPIHKRALVFLHIIVDEERGKYYRAFSNLTGVAEPSLYEAHNIQMVRVMHGGRSILSVENYDAWVPVPVETSGEPILNLKTIERYVDKVSAMSFKSDPVKLLMARGYMIYFLINNLDYLGVRLEVGVNAPPVVKVGEYLFTHPLALGTLKDIGVYRSVVPVLTGDRVVNLSVEELKSLIIYYMDVLPELMSTVNDIIRVVVKALEEARVKNVLAKLSVDKVFEALGVGILAAAEAKVEESKTGEISGDNKGEKGLDEEAVKKAAKAVTEFLMDLGEE